MNVIGSFEKVSFPTLGIKGVVAKIDTGAYSGALHATGIKELRVGNDLVLQFYPCGNKALKTRVKKFIRKPVKSSNGIAEERYVIRTKLDIRGEIYPITISLANRKSMKNEILIGRRFLLGHGFIVDVSKGSQYRNGSGS